MPRCHRTALISLPLALSACYTGVSTEPSGTAAGGSDTDPDTPGSTDPDDADPAAPATYTDPRALGPVSMRRLSLAELRTTLESLFGPQPDDLLDALPRDGKSPFDNDVIDQTPSRPWVEGMRHIAGTVADGILHDANTRDGFIGCSPSGPDDEACLRSFVTDFGSRAFRRPLEPADVESYVELIDWSREEGDFDVAVRLVIEAVIQDPQFAYLVEVGTPTDDADLIELDDYEVATRLSYLLWGAPPTEEIFAIVEAGELSDRSAVRAAAASMLDDPRGQAQLQRFHALWLEYEDLPLEPDLASALRQETDALVARVLEDNDWTRLFTSTQTFVGPELAVHYDLGVDPEEPGWVDYPDDRRGGVLSHGSVLSVGKKFGDTSPVERGKHILTRMLCRDMPPPPPTVDSGVPPTGGPIDACKPQRYNMTELAECAGCHAVLDPLGFGLENFGPAGEWRDTEPDRPDCAIEGSGELAGQGSYQGPAELGALLLATGELEPCVTRHFVQFAIGRPTTEDDLIVEQLGQQLRASPDFRSILFDFVGSEAFRHRVID